MSLKDDLVLVERKSAFETLFEQLDKEDRDALQNAFNDPDWSNAALVRVLNDNGFRVSKDTISKHRRALAGR